MTIILFIIPFLLLVSTIGVQLIQKRWPRFVYHAAAIVATLSLGLWLLAEPSLPLAFRQEQALSSISQPFLNLRIDRAGWFLSFSVLLLVTIFLTLEALGVNKAEKDRSPNGLGLSEPSLLLFLTLSVLLTVWADDLISLIVTWALFVVSWWLWQWAVVDSESEMVNLNRRTGFLATSVLLLGLANALAPGGVADFEIQNWSTAARIALLMASLVALGVLPLHWWRLIGDRFPARASVWVIIFPALCGASLLMRITAATEVDLPVLLALSFFALLGLLRGARMAWIHTSDLRLLAVELAFFQANIIVIAGIWLSEAAVLVESLVYILSVGGLLVFSRLKRCPAPWLIIVPVLALAGFPLTAGFLSKALLISAWLTGLRIILLFAYVLTLVLALAALLTALRQDRRPRSKFSPTLNIFHQDLILALPTLSLLLWPGIPIDELSLVSTVLIILAWVGAIVLSHYAGRLHEIQQAIGMIYRVDFRNTWLSDMISTAFAFLAMLMREATAVLEGEGGMIWLLLLIVILWLAQVG